MKKILFLFASLFFCVAFAQDDEIVNPQSKLYIGAETGLNVINNYNLNQDDISIQGGVLAEYYIAKQWSLQGRIKYYKTGLSFYRPDTHSGSWFDLGHDESFGTFSGSVIAILVNIKWEFRVFKNLRAYLKTGAAYNFEIKSEYNYSSNLSTDYPKTYGTIYFGTGLTYFLNDKLSIYVDQESFVGGAKGTSEGLIFTEKYYSQNFLVNFGVKYNIK